MYISCERLIQGSHKRIDLENYTVGYAFDDFKIITGKNITFLPISALDCSCLLHIWHTLEIRNLCFSRFSNLWMIERRSWTYYWTTNGRANSSPPWSWPRLRTTSEVKVTSPCSLRLTKPSGTCHKKRRKESWRITSWSKVGDGLFMMDVTHAVLDLSGFNSPLVPLDLPPKFSLTPLV